MKKGCSNKKTIFPKLLAILVSLIFVLQITSQAAQDINLGNATSEKEQTVKKTEVITTFEWIEDVDRSIGDIEIKEDGRKVDMVGNPTNPGKNAIYLIPENHQEQNLTFDYTVDYGDSFNAAGILLKIREQNGYLEGYLLSFNNPSASDSSDWYGAAQNQLGAIWTIRYKLKDNRNNDVEKSLVKAIDLPVSGRISVKATENQIVLTGDSINETVDTTGNSEIGDGFGFFTNHYSHGCDQIGHFALTNFGLTTVDLIPHDFIVDPNGGIWNNSGETTAIEGIYQDQVQVPLPTREGYTFVKWTKIGDSGTMSSLTEDAVYTFGENEEVDDKIIAEWIRITGEKASIAQSDKVKVDDIITYEIKLKNEGTVDGKAIIKDDAPEGTTFVENSIKINNEQTQSTLQDLNNGITVDVPLGGETKLTFDVKVHDLNDDDIISNKADFQDITVQGKETASETNQVDLTYIEPIISAEKQATTQNGNEYVETNETIEYQITVENAGGLAKDVIIKDNIPEGTTFTENSIKINGQETQYTKEDLENGIQVNAPEKIRREDTQQEANILNLTRAMQMDARQTDALPSETILTFEVTVDEQKDENQIHNIAQVDEMQTNQIDHIYRKPVISAEKQIKTQNEKEYVVSDETIEYSIIVENKGSIEKNVIIKDNIPEGTTFIENSINIDGEETEYSQENLEEGIEIIAPKKHIKEEIENPNDENNQEGTDIEEGQDENEGEDITQEGAENVPEENTNTENQDNNEVTPELQALSASKETSRILTMVGTENSIENQDDITTNENENEDTNTTEENNNENNNTTGEDTNTVEDEETVENPEEETDEEEPKEDGSNMQENEESGITILTFKVKVDTLKEENQTQTIVNIAQVDEEETNEVTIEALPFNMKIENEITGFTVNGQNRPSKDVKFAKTDIDMRKSSPTPDVTANIKIKVTNSGKVDGSATVEATIPEGFTLSNTSTTQWDRIDASKVTTKTEDIPAGETIELSLDAHWTNSETNFGNKETQAKITETIGEVEVAETTTEDNEDKSEMVIGIVTGEYDNIIKLAIIGAIGLIAISSAIIIIRKYVL